MRPKKTDRTSSATGVAAVQMCLYIAGCAPNSAQAIINIETICEKYFKDNFKLEVVDVLVYPLRALADGILVTPSLTKLCPAPVTKIVGNLSDTGSVLRALGING